MGGISFCCGLTRGDSGAKGGGSAPPDQSMRTAIALPSDTDSNSKRRIIVWVFLSPFALIAIGVVGATVFPNSWF